MSLLLTLAGLLFPSSVSASPRSAVPAQRLQPTPESEQTSFRTEHFDVVYVPGRLSREEAEAAGRQAEAGWAHCQKLFGPTVSGRIHLDLSPNFFGATGF